jgi:tetratricopeptide (TPR) repeat protein
LAGWLALGNEALTRTPANNLALCYYRLGAYEEQRKVLEAVLYLPDRDRPTADVLFSHYLAGLGAAIVGHGETALHHADIIRRLFGSTSIGWLRQRALLSVADLQYLLNMRSKALATARSAVTGALDTPVAKQTVGTYSRWVAVLGMQTYDRTSAIQSIERLASELHAYDLVDQLEVLSGLGILRPLIEEEREALHVLWTVLPEEVPVQLRLLGLSVDL